MLKSPFPYFGGKRRVAAEVWRRFGDVKNYVEPFCGSAAILLSRPTQPRIETINDLDGYLANFWRATKHDPAQVAQWCDWPISEVDLHSRHRWLMAQDIRQRMLDDPDFYDAQIAGWWAWGQSMWIGSGWCRWPNAKARPGLLTAEGGVHRPAQKIPHVTKDRGVLALMQKRPHLVHGERGVQRQMPMLVQGGGSGVHRATQQMPVMNRGSGVHRVRCDLNAYFEVLADRLRRVRVCCGDWSRVCTHCVTDYQGLTAVFLDPPYGKKAGREKDLYATDSLKVAEDARRWAIEHGESDQFRIALCGYEGEHEMPGNWSVHAWKRAGGYGNKTNKGRERIWFSPHCLGGQGTASFGRTISPLPANDVVRLEPIASSNPEDEATKGVCGVICTETEQKESGDMAAKFTERDLQRCGLTVDPQNPTQVVPIDREAMPDDTWDLDRLAQYAVTGIAEAGRLRREALQLARRSTVQTYRAGRALFLAHEKLKAKRQWCGWCKDHRIPRVTAWEAMELFKRAGSEEAVAKLTLTQAKNKFDITKPPKRRPAELTKGTSANSKAATAVPKSAPQVLPFPAGDMDEPSGEEGYDHDQWQDQPAEQGQDREENSEASVSPEDFLSGLVKIMNCLEYLAEDVGRIDWKKESVADHLGVMDRGIDLMQRIRERMVA